MTSRFSRFLIYAPFLGVVLFFVAVVYRQFITPGEVLRMSDFVFPNVNNHTNFNLSVYSWTSYGLGQPCIPTFSMALIYTLAKFFGVPFAQQCFGFAPFFVASAAMYVFLMRTRWIESRFWAAVIAILYFSNWPVFSYEGDNAALMTVTGLMWTYAVTPLVMLFAHRIFVEKQCTARNVILLALSSFIASLTNSQALILLSGVLAPFIVCYACDAIFAAGVDKKRGVLRLFLVVFGWFGIYFLLALPVNMSLLSSVFLTGNVQALYGVKATLVPLPEVYEFVYTYFVSPLILLSTPHPNQPIEWLGLATPVLIIAGILLEDNRRKKLIASLVFAWVLLLSGWIHLVITAPEFIEQVYALPVLGQFLQVIRNPLKLFMFLVPALMILLALGIANVAKQALSFGSGRIKSSPVLMFLIGFALIGSSVVAIFLNHNNRIFHLRETYIDKTITRSGQGGEHALPFGRLNGDYVKVTHDLKAMGPGRILWLPNENEIWVQTTQIDFDNVLSYPSSLTMGLYQKEIVDLLANNKPSILARTLALLRIRFIVVLKSVKQTGEPRIWGTPPWGEHIVGDPAAFITSLEAGPGFSKIKEDASFVIYENQYFQ